jgi:hypothetical protein
MKVEPDPIGWERADLRDPCAAALAESIVGIAAGNGSSTVYDLAWLLEADGRSPDDAGDICAGNGLCAYAPFVVSQDHALSIGRWPSWAFERLPYSGLIVGDGSGSRTTELVADLARLLRS